MDVHRKTTATLCVCVCVCEGVSVGQMHRLSRPPLKPPLSPKHPQPLPFHPHGVIQLVVLEPRPHCTVEAPGYWLKLLSNKWGLIYQFNFIPPPHSNPSKKRSEEKEGGGEGKQIAFIFCCMNRRGVFGKKNPNKSCIPHISHPLISPCCFANCQPVSSCFIFTAMIEGRY